MVHLTRRYCFSAAHRLHSDALSAEENARVYGKCNGPHGHGHNYVLEVAVKGFIDPATGMVIDISLLDDVVSQEIMEPFDHRYLNADVPCFRQRVPTAENICVEVFERLQARMVREGVAASTQLESVRLQETRCNFFEYSGPIAEMEVGLQKRGDQ